MYKKVLAYFLSFAIILSLFTVTPIRVNADVPIAPTIEERASGNNYHALYANGLPLLIEEGMTSGYSNVKYDSNGDGEYDTVFRENIDLSGYDVFGGSPDTDCYAADIKMTGGKVHYILGGGHKSGSIEGDIKIGVSGGYIAEISSGCYTNTGTSAHVAGDAEIIISGGEIGGIYGGGWAWGSASYSVMRNSTINISGGTIDKVEGGWVGSSGSSNITDSFAINISGGTIKGNVSVSDYVSEDADKTINITGGTIRGTVGGATPTNGTDFVYKTALRFMDGEEAKKNTFVSTLATNPDCGYGMTDVLTDGNGKIFVYLPEGTLTTAGVIDGDNYINTEGITTLSNNMAGGDLVFAPDSSEDYIFDISHGNITITDGTGEGTYKVIYGPEVSQQQKDNIPQMQTITITGNGADNIITVSATIGTVKIKLAGMIASCMMLTSSDTRDVEIILQDETDNIIGSSLKNESGPDGGGLTITCEHYEEEGHICSDACGSLTASGSNCVPGIYGDNTTINGGNIFATAGHDASGIGKWRNSKNISINGGRVTSTGSPAYGGGAAGIGGSDIGSADGIYINGGIVNATGAGNSSGIGGGAYYSTGSGQAHNIIISGGTVKATSGGAGIGGPKDCSNIQINGGSVNAKSISIPPVNADGINVYLTTITLSGAGAWKQVTNLEISGADYFNQKDIFTDDNEKIYLYLPEGANVIGATAGGSSYGGSITTTNDNLAAETFTLPISPPVLQSAVTNIGGTAVVLVFDKDMADPQNKYDEFTVMADDSLNVVTAVALGADDTKTIELGLTTAIEFGQEVKVSYSEGTVTSSDGGLLASFIDRQVENNVSEPTYTINVGSLSGGSIEPSVISATAGTTINLTITPDADKRIKDGTLKYNDGTKDTSIDETTKSFEMPAADIAITAEFEDIPEATYTITMGSFSGGSIVASEISAIAGTAINLIITSDTGKRLKVGTLKYNDGMKDTSIDETTKSFAMPATNVTVTAEFENIPSSGSSGRSSAGESTPLDTGTEVTVITTDGKTSVVGTLTETEGTVRVVIKNNDFNKIDIADKPAIVNVQLATVTFDERAMDAIGAVAGSGDVILTVRQIPISELLAVQKEQVGTRPVYDFAVTGDNKAISDFNGGYAIISIPYALAAGENPHAIVIWYLSDSGKLVGMRGHYDVGTKSVIFKTLHFSGFIIGYNFVGFKDVPGDAWYESAVTFLAARGITTGTGDGKFSPDAALTRGQFIVMLMRAYGIESDTNPADNFADAGSTYYTNYLAVAKRLGISAGIGNNLFAPDREITRQEMFTLLYNTLTVIGEIPEGNSGKRLSDFNDATGISPWAKEAMTLLVETGTVSGSDGKLFPTNSTTRAEMAQVLYNLLIK